MTKNAGQEVIAIRLGDPSSTSTSNPDAKKHMMVKSMEKKNTKKMLTTFKPTALNKKMLPMLDFHMLQLFFKLMLQVKSLFQILVFHI